MQDMPYEQICIGDKASFSKVIEEGHLASFADITGDFNPIHLDSDFAARTRFKKRIVHGMLTNSLISAVLGTKLPGMNTLYLSQNSKFVAPAFIGDELTATVEVKEKKDEKKLIILKTVVTNQLGNEISIGEAIVKKMDA
ncbi:MaoC family dehydratase [Marinisporobacter balticus]|uniref:3-hydroxybutyryl-CoA dehydratase n=1 Tax=Marinisporobacter balticus TaxID=2018667 RepID=A0A4R2L2I9_9FIRM|nr:MaoC family dehydratase [Marinisporobacter balticus]TCO77976.1 3-hydroxybutyryl-CoA dehydratase [Marinisporobacter balticus]